jgi:hypothetical protein
VLKWAGDQLKAAFNNEEMQNALGALQDAFQQLWTQLQPLLPVLKIIAIVLGAILLGALIVVLHVFMALIAALPNVIYAFASIIRIVGDLARIIIDLFTNWGDLGAAFDALGHDILILLQNVLDAARIYISTLFGDLGKAIAGKIGEWWNDVVGAVGGFFSNLGKSFQIGGMLIADIVGGWAGVVGAVFSAFGARLRAVVLNVIYFIVGLFVLLYYNVPIVHQFVDAVVSGFWLLHDWIVTILTVVGTFLHAAWETIKTDAHVAWQAFYDYVAHPVGELFSWIGTQLHWVAAVLQSIWSIILTDANRVWTTFVAIIASKVNDVLGAAKHTTDPIQKTIENLVNLAVSWGQNLIGNFIKGITSKWADLVKTFQSIVDLGNNFLHGKSPPPGWPEQGQFGANLVNVFSAGIVGSIPVLQGAMKQLTASAQSQMNASVGVNASGGAGAHLIGGGGGGGTQNITINFPNATNADQIEEALNRVLNLRDKGNYAKSRRAGAYSAVGGHY